MDPDTAPDAPPTRSNVRTRNVRTRVASIAMAAALCAFVGSALLFTLPVSNPGVQNCGSPAWFLLRAQSNTPLFGSDGKPVNGWNEAELRKAYESRCSVQVADRAVPGGILLVVFWVLVVAAWTVGFTGRRALRRALIS